MINAGAPERARERERELSHTTTRSPATTAAWRSSPTSELTGGAAPPATTATAPVAVGRRRVPERPVLLRSARKQVGHDGGRLTHDAPGAAELSLQAVGTAGANGAAQVVAGLERVLDADEVALRADAHRPVCV